MYGEDQMQWPMDAEALLPFSCLTKFKKIGAGGCGNVYRAQLEGFKRAVAVKVLAVDDVESRELFVQEAVILQGLAHKNIASFIGLVNIPKGARNVPEASNQPRLAFVEELVEGGTLSELIMKQTMEPWRRGYSYDHALDILEGIAEAMCYLHSQRPRLLHRDLKPENILLSKIDGQYCPKIVDFGLTARIDESGWPLKRLSKSALLPQSHPWNSWMDDTMRNDTYSSLPVHINNPMTAAFEFDIGEARGGFYGYKGTAMDVVVEEDDSSAEGSVSDDEKEVEFWSAGENYPWKNAHTGQLTGQTGSFMYMAPEVFTNSVYDEKADVFSFGVIAYEIITRSLLVTTETEMKGPHEAKCYAEKVCKGYRPELPRWVPSDIQDLCERCLEMAPQHRPSMAEVSKILQSLRERNEEDTLVVEPTPKFFTSFCRCM